MCSIFDGNHIIFASSDLLNLVQFAYLLVRSNVEDVCLHLTFGITIPNTEHVTLNSNTKCSYVNKDRVFNGSLNKLSRKY